MILNNFVNQTKRFNFDKTSVTLPVQLVPAIYVLSKAEVIYINNRYVRETIQLLLSIFHSC
jgi:hypothetical protein